jgi:hypothetical protein
MYAITFAALAVIWSYVVALTAGIFGPNVSGRLLERPGKIPSTGKELTRNYAQSIPSSTR